MGIHHTLENGNKMNVEMYNLIFIKNLNFWEIILWAGTVENKCYLNIKADPRGPGPQKMFIWYNKTVQLVLDPTTKSKGMKNLYNVHRKNKMFTITTLYS